VAECCAHGNELYIGISVRVGPGSSVGIATDYGLDGPGIESWRGQDFPPIQTGPGAYPASCTMGTGSFPGVKCGRGVLLTTHPLLVLWSWKSRAIPLPPLGHNRTCNGVTLLYISNNVVRICVWIMAVFYGVYTYGYSAYCIRTCTYLLMIMNIGVP
jgi:hypothetical protein